MENLSSKAQEIPDTIPQFVERAESRRNRRVMSAYYHPRHAVEVKALLDKILQDSKPRLLPIAEFEGISKQVLSQKVQYAWLWLIDNADKDGQYSSLRTRMSISVVEHGVLLKFKSVAKFERAKTVEEVDTSWKRKLDDFLEDAKSGEMLKLTNLVLSDEEVKAIEDSMTGITGFIYKVDNNSIKVMKETE